MYRASTENGNADLVLGDSDDAEDPELGHGSKIIMSDYFFKPIYAIGEWLDDDDLDNKKLVIAISLFTGTEKRSKVTLTVADDGNTLEYSVSGPKKLVDVVRLHDKWLKGRDVPQLQSYHPMIKALKPFS